MEKKFSPNISIYSMHCDVSFSAKFMMPHRVSKDEHLRQLEELDHTGDISNYTGSGLTADGREYFVIFRFVIKGRMLSQTLVVFRSPDDVSRPRK